MEGEPHSSSVDINQSDQVSSKHFKKELKQKVYFNPIVRDALVSISSLNEMKNLSLVCKDFYKKVRLSKYFKEDAALVIGNNHDFGLRNLSIGDLLPSSKKPEIANYPWKGLKFDLTTDFWLREYNFPIMNSLEYLAFVRWLRLMTIGPNIPNVMKELLKSSPNLKHLQLDFSIFLKQNAPLRKFFTNSKVRDNLKNLERLDIVEIEFAQNKFPGEYTDVFYYQWENRDMEGSIDDMESFKTLASVPNKLKIFKTNTITVSWELRKEDVRTILINNQDSFEEIWMHANLWMGEDMQQLRFPNLKRLHITIGGNLVGQSNLSEFLKCHLQIDKLDLTVLLYGRLQSMLFHVIHDLSGNLKTLHLTANDYEYEGTSIDWSFLGLMTKLLDFSILIPTWKGAGTGQEFLAALPANQLKKLRLWSLNSTDNFWSVNKPKCSTEEDCAESEEEESDNESKEASSDSETEDEINNDKDTKKMNEMINQGDPEIPKVNYKLDLLGKFTCLQSLSLTCHNAVDDEVMHFISKEFQCLQELEIQNAFKLTDVGITGRWSTFMVGVPISNLKGLRKLIIRECPLVTHDGILKSVEFPGLKYLDFKNSYVLAPEDFAYTILEQNPSMEELSLKFHFEDEGSRSHSKEAFSFLFELKEGGSRIRRKGGPYFDGVNQQLRKIWGSGDGEYYWAHCLYGHGATNAQPRDYT